MSWSWWEKRPPDAVVLAGTFVGAIRESSVPTLERLLLSQLEMTITVAAGAAAFLVSGIAGELLKAVVKVLSDQSENPVLAKIEFLRSAPLRRATIQLVVQSLLFIRIC